MYSEDLPSRLVGPSRLNSCVAQLSDGVAASAALYPPDPFPRVSRAAKNSNLRGGAKRVGQGRGEAVQDVLGIQATVAKEVFQLRPEVLPHVIAKQARKGPQGVRQILRRAPQYVSHGVHNREDILLRSHAMRCNAKAIQCNPMQSNETQRNTYLLRIERKERREGAKHPRRVWGALLQPRQGAKQPREGPQLGLDVLEKKRGVASHDSCGVLHAQLEVDAQEHVHRRHLTWNVGHQQRGLGADRLVQPRHSIAAAYCVYAKLYQKLDGSFHHHGTLGGEELRVIPLLHAALQEVDAAVCHAGLQRSRRISNELRAEHGLAHGVRLGRGRGGTRQPGCFFQQRRKRLRSDVDILGRQACREAEEHAGRRLQKGRQHGAPERLYGVDLLRGIRLRSRLRWPPRVLADRLRAEAQSCQRLGRAFEALPRAGIFPASPT
eukprot:scaffold447_cov307-Pinguiococcus_pyrenoidosus.AAC.56